MKYKTYIFSLMVMIIYTDIYAAVQPITPGELLYGIVSRIGIEEDAIYDTVTEIDTKIDQLAIAVNNLSVQDALIYDTATEIDGKVDQLAIDINNVSVQDALIYDTVTEIDAKVDTLTIDVNNLSVQDALIYMTSLEINSQLSSLIVTLTSNDCSTLDGLIYDTVTDIDTKIDILTTNVNNLSEQNVLIYNLESVIDSKVDEIRSFPDFVQTPTSFQSQGISAKTSRYFFTKRTVSGLTGTESIIFSLWNTSPTTVVRISAVGCGMDVDYTPGSAGNMIGTFVPFYKDATLVGASFNSFDVDSVLQIDTSAVSFSGGKQVYELQAGTTSVTAGSIARAFETFPKETYSVIIAPNEILTVTAGVATLNIADTATIILMWEEIIA